MKFSYIFIFCTFLLGACTPANTPTPLPTAVPLATNTPPATNISNTPILSPTEPASIPSATTTPGPISTFPKCTDLKAQDILSADYRTSGVMLSIDRPPYSLVSGWGPDKESSLYYLDLSTRLERFLIKPDDYQKQVKKKIIRLEVEDLSVSPDFLKAVYLVDAYVDESDWDPKKSWLEIYDANTKERKRIPWQDEWTYIVGWVNNEYFAIRSGGSMLFLDSSGSTKKQFLASKYPDYSNPRAYSPSTFVIWGGYRKSDGYSFDSGGGNMASIFLSSRSQARVYNPTLEIYDPSLEYVIYTEVKDRRPGIVLYEIKTQQKVVEITTGDKVEPAAFGGVPVWSPNGNNALMLLPAISNSSRQALFLLDISGNIEQLTTFEVLGPYSWSPDGKFAAFWLANGRELGILDVTNKSLRSFCVWGGYDNKGRFPIGLDGIPTSGDLVWLPNNKILIEVSKMSGQSRYEGIAVADLEENTLIELKWNARFPVWLQQ